MKAMTKKDLEEKVAEQAFKINLQHGEIANLKTENKKFTRKYDRAKGKINNAYNALDTYRVVKFGADAGVFTEPEQDRFMSQVSVTPPVCDNMPDTEDFRMLTHVQGLLMGIPTVDND